MAKCLYNTTKGQRVSYNCLPKTCVTRIITLPAVKVGKIFVFLEKQKKNDLYAIESVSGKITYKSLNKTLSLRKELKCTTRRCYIICIIWQKMIGGRIPRRPVAFTAALFHCCSNWGAHLLYLVANSNQHNDIGYPFETCVSTAALHVYNAYIRLV